VEKNEITDKVFAQIGQSTYKPKHYNYTDFLTSNEYTEKVNKANLIITHGGTGAIIKGLKAGKQVIAVPRRVTFGEHSDDHQLQIVELFTDQGYVWRVDEMGELLEVINKSKTTPIIKRFQRDGKIIDIIDDFISDN
jgi:UDP-N-acetylglucosamine transferase subunit ALG13